MASGVVAWSGSFFRPYPVLWGFTRETISGSA